MQLMRPGLNTNTDLLRFRLSILPRETKCQEDGIMSCPIPSPKKLVEVQDGNHMVCVCVCAEGALSSSLHTKQGRLSTQI